MKPTIRVAVIGAGNMGRHHARVYSQVAQLVAISDVNQAVGEELATRYGAVYHSDYRKMLTAEKIDAVSVVVPTGLHFQVTADCLKSRLATLVEKPITDNLADARKLLQLAKKYDTQLMVGHIERFNPAIIKLQQMIDKNFLGELISMMAVRVGIAPPSTPKADVVLDLAIHDIDIFNALLKEFPIRVSVVKRKMFKQNLCDSATVVLEYKKAVGMVMTNWITPIKMRRLYVTGTDGFAELDYITQKLIYHRGVIDKAFDGNFYEFISLSKNTKKEIFVSRKEPLREELVEFLRSYKKPDYHSVIYAIKALELVTDYARK